MMKQPTQVLKKTDPELLVPLGSWATDAAVAGKK